jgi:hypothetical protein
MTVERKLRSASAAEPLRVTHRHAAGIDIHANVQARFQQCDFTSIYPTRTYDFAKPAWHHTGPLMARWFPHWLPPRVCLLRHLLDGWRYGDAHALENVARRALQFATQPVVLARLLDFYILHPLQVADDVCPLEVMGALL